MAGDVTVGYDGLQEAANRLRTGRQDLVTTLKGLQSVIDALTGAGFRTRQASGRFDRHYRQWDASANELITTVDEIARAIEDAKQRHEHADQALAAAVGTAATGVGGGAALAGAARSSRGGGGPAPTAPVHSGTGAPRTPGGGGSGGGGPAGSGGGGGAGGRGREPVYEVVAGNRVQERLRQIDGSRDVRWGRAHQGGDRYAYDRVRLPDGATFTRTQGLRVTVTKPMVRPPGAARETSPPAALKDVMEGYGNRYKLQLGHLWADRLGGPNAARNFVPVHPHTNGGGMAYVEGRVADAARRYGQVELVALPRYVGDEPIPRSILYAWKAPGESSWTAVNINNLP